MTSGKKTEKKVFGTQFDPFRNGKALALQIVKQCMEIAYLNGNSDDTKIFNFISSD